MESNPPGPLINRLEWFCWKMCFRGDNREICDSALTITLSGVRKLNWKKLKKCTNTAWSRVFRTLQSNIFAKTKKFVKPFLFVLIRPRPNLFSIKMPKNEMKWKRKKKICMICFKYPRGSINCLIKNWKNVLISLVPPYWLWVCSAFTNRLQLWRCNRKKLNFKILNI